MLHSQIFCTLNNLDFNAAGVHDMYNSMKVTVAVIYGVM